MFHYTALQADDYARTMPDLLSYNSDSTPQYGNKKRIFCTKLLTISRLDPHQLRIDTWVQLLAPYARINCICFNF